MKPVFAVLKYSRFLQPDARIWIASRTVPSAPQRNHVTGETLIFSMGRRQRFDIEYSGIAAGSACVREIEGQRCSGHGRKRLARRVD
jgi:hypothetical protein